MRAAAIARASVPAIATTINRAAAVDRTATIDSPAAIIPTTTVLIVGIAITAISAAVGHPAPVNAAPIHGCAPVAATISSAISASIATASAATIGHLLDQVGIIPLAA
jgi:hypothetical protein